MLQQVFITEPPSVAINIDEISTTSITISLNTTSHPACGEVSYVVSISGNVVYPDTAADSKYIIDKLESDTLYNITVRYTYSSDSKIVYQSVKTSLLNCKYQIKVMIAIICYLCMLYICMHFHFALQSFG